jgi:hypothetical protein
MSEISEGELCDKPGIDRHDLNAYEEGQSGFARICCFASLSWTCGRTTSSRTKSDRRQTFISGSYARSPSSPTAIVPLHSAIRASRRGWTSRVAWICACEVSTTDIDAGSIIIPAKIERTVWPLLVEWLAASFCGHTHLAAVDEIDRGIEDYAIAGHYSGVRFHPCAEITRHSDRTNLGLAVVDYRNL